MNDISEFKDGSDLMKKDPDPVFEKILSRGYKLLYTTETEIEANDKILIKVVCEGMAIGEADFVNDTNERYVVPQNVRVNCSYQRQGIASAMYVFAEKLTSKTLFPFWQVEQSPKAKAFWAQPNRRFGKLLK